MLQQSHDFWEVHVLPAPCRILLSFNSFGLHVLLWCVLTYNHRGNSYLYRWQLMHALLPTTKTHDNKHTARLLKPVCPSLESPIYNLHVLDASVSKWLMQCYASLTAEVCLESEILLRSYHLKPPSLPLISKTAIGSQASQREYT